MSDHKYIRFDIIRPHRDVSSIRIPKHTNWESFSLKLNDDLLGYQSSTRSTDDLDEYADHLSGSIIRAYECSSRCVRISGKRDVPWWNNHLEALKRAARKHFNRAKRTGDWETYRTSLSNYNKELRKSKRASWRAFCGRVETLPAACRLQKALSLNHRNPLGSVRSSDGSLTSSRKETLNCLVRKHFPNCVVIGDPMQQARELAESRHYPSRARHFMSNIFTQGNIQWAINSFKPFKAPGGDGIYPVFLQRGLVILTPHLIKLFRASLRLEYVPRCWRKVNVIFIPKPGNRSAEETSSYRPISLSSFLLKTMEKIIGQYIRSHTLLEHPISPCQHAYQAGKSTETALHELVYEIEDTLQKKEVLACAFIDIQGAFDNTPFEVISQVARHRGAESPLIKWITNMLITRNITANFGAESITIAATRGCPQGGVLSPLLWLLVMDQLISRLKAEGFSIVSYADDLVIMVRGKYENTISERMQHALNVVRDWCTNSGLSINPDKIGCVTFTKRRNRIFKSPMLNGKTIRVIKEIKFLGVILDEKLTWNSHIDYVSRKAIKAYFVCQSMFGKTWGLNPKMVIWLYSTIIKPMVSYASLVWWPKTEQRKADLLLTKLQRLVCLGATGATKTCPTAALENILGLTPLSLHIKKIAGLRSLILKTTGQIKTDRPGHGSILSKINQAEELVLFTDIMEKRIDCDRNFTILIPSEDSVEDIISSLPQHSSIWYTDGSKTGNGTGAGVFGPNFTSYTALGRTPTVFQAEAVAIEVCALQCIKRGYRRTEIYIISDSQAVLLSIAASDFNSKLIFSCYCYLKLLANNNKVTLMWSPGHAGIIGNETADCLARAGSSLEFHGPEPSVAYSRSHLRRSVGAWLSNLNSTYWRNQTGMSQTKAFLNYNIKNLNKAGELDRTTLRTLTWYITGHGPFNNYLFKIGKSQSDRCRFCALACETPEHILFKCDAIARRRVKFLKVYLVHSQTKPIYLADLIAFIRDLNFQFH